MLREREGEAEESAGRVCSGGEAWVGFGALARLRELTFGRGYSHCRRVATHRRHAGMVSSHLTFCCLHPRQPVVLRVYLSRFRVCVESGLVASGSSEVDAAAAWLPVWHQSLPITGLPARD